MRVCGRRRRNERAEPEPGRARLGAPTRAAGDWLSQPGCGAGRTGRGLDEAGLLCGAIRVWAVTHNATHSCPGFKSLRQKATESEYSFEQGPVGE